MQNKSIDQQAVEPLELSHQAEFYYPGDFVVFKTKLVIKKALSDLTLTITLPKGIKVILDDQIKLKPKAKSSEGSEGETPASDTSPNGTKETPNDGRGTLEQEAESSEVSWKLTETLPGQEFDYNVVAVMGETPVPDQDEPKAVLVSRAVVKDKAQKILLEEQASLIPVVVSHVANIYRRYSGESVTFHTRIKVFRALRGFKLTVRLPQGIEFLSAHISTKEPSQALPSEKLAAKEQGAEAFSNPFISSHKKTDVIWDIRETSAGSCFDCEVEGEIVGVQKESTLESEARFELNPKEEKYLSNSAKIQVAIKSDYMRYLPGIYQKDELMGRFLMLFESFWKPIEDQIDNIPFYFDPLMTSSALLKWLGELLNVELNEEWPEERQRKLIKNAGALYRQRGTKRGLKEYLEICTNGTVKITEYHGQNMILGPKTFLGTGIALGKKNAPYTFEVILLLSASNLEEKPKPGTDEYRRRICAIIDAQKPAHTKYRLEIKIKEEEQPDLGPHPRPLSQ